MPELRYVSRIDPDDWLLVMMDTGEKQSLPYGLEVDLTGFEDGRDHFKILEGLLMGRSASVKRDGTRSYLIDTIHHDVAAELRFNRKKQELWINGRGPFNAFSGHFRPVIQAPSGHDFTQVPPGRYVIQIPDAPHAATRVEYAAYTAVHHRTWFRIGKSGDRYLHVGEISEGCVTVRAFVLEEKTQPPRGFNDLPGLPHGAVGLPYPTKAAPVAKWDDDVYDDLILRRFDHLSVGHIVVE
jgi:hypothetical protein